MVSSLVKDEIDSIKMPFLSTLYLMSSQTTFTMHRAPNDKIINYSFAFLNEDQDLCNQFDQAINVINSNHEIHKLMYENIWCVIEGKQAETAHFSLFPNAPTVRIGVTGDLPPLDFVSKTGQPIGFCTALCAEIGRILKVNIELVLINSKDRGTSLLNKNVDALFYLVTSTDESEPIYNEKTFSDEVITTSPYFNDKLYYLKKNQKDYSLNVTGEISFLNISERDLKEELDSSRSKKYFNNLNSMLTALNNHQLDSAFLPSLTASYLSALYPNLQIAATHGEIISYSMAVNQENKPLVAKINNALRSLNQDGTLSLLKEKVALCTRNGNFSMYDTEPPSFPEFPNAPTITVAVTGDLPPFDYIKPTGEPFGFNVELLYELSMRLQINIKIITIDSGSRMLALKNGQTDVVFWAVANFINKDGSSGIIFSELDMPDGIFMTIPYLFNTRMSIELME